MRTEYETGRTTPQRWARMTGNTARVTFSGPNRRVSTCARKSCVVGEHVDVAKAGDGCLHRCLGILGAGDVELDNTQVVSLADGLGDSIGVAASCNDRVPGGQSGPGDMYAHSTACAGNKPNVLMSHRTSSFTRLYRHEKLQEPTRSLFSPIMFSYFL